MSDEASDPPRRPAQANTAWWWALGIWVVCALVTFGSMRLLLPWDQTPVPGSMSLVRFAQLRPWASWTVLALTPAIWIAAGAWVQRLTRRTGVVVAVTVSLLGVMACTAGNSFGWARASSWREADRARTPDGNTYYVAFERLFIDHETALGIVRQRGFLTERVELVERGEVGPGDAGHLLVPRDTDLAEKRPILIVCDDGGLAVVRHEPGYATGALFARDPDGAPRVVDPFLLFGADDVGDEAAVDAWQAWFGMRTSLGREPRDQDLRAALDHESAWVRTAAAAIVEAGGPTRFPNATRALEAAR